MTLKLLVTMLLRGADIVDLDSSDSQARLSVAQTILFNCKIKATATANKRELPLGRVGIPWSMNHLYPSTLIERSHTDKVYKADYRAACIKL